MADLIAREVIEIPPPPLLHVRPPRLWRDAASDLAARQVRQPINHVDAGGLQQRPADAPRRTPLAGAPCLLGVHGAGALLPVERDRHTDERHDWVGELLDEIRLLLHGRVGRLCVRRARRGQTRDKHDDRAYATHNEHSRTNAVPGRYPAEYRAKRMSPRDVPPKSRRL